jgi:hypothetical protein
LLLVLIAVVRLVAAQASLSPTTDQPIHLFTGLEWLERGSYAFEPLHPPLARVLMALPPYLVAGLRLPPEAKGFDCPSFLQTLKHLRPNRKRFSCMSHLPVDIRGFFASRADYDRLFRLAGIGTLPLFLLAAAVVWQWTARLHDEATALVAVFVFTTLPAVLGHAGVATTDMALVGTLPAALYAFGRLLERATPRRACVFGAACGLALLSKYTAVLFLPVGLAVVAWSRPRAAEPAPDTAPSGPPSRRLGLRPLILAALAAILTVWTGYRFSVGSLDELVPGLHEAAVRRGPVATALASAPLVPAPEFFHGAYDAAAKATAGHAHYVLGRSLDREGVWYFFPVALLFKTPLAALAAFVGGVWAGRSTRAGRLPPFLAAATLLAVIPTDVNVGVRHVLVVYPFLAMAAALGLRRLVARPVVPRVAGVALIVSQLASSALAHPDGLAYFNLLAGSRPEEVLIDSDLDWGQDMKRLGARVRALGIREITVCCSGEVPLAPYAPGVRDVRDCPDRPRPGWLAVSVGEARHFHRDALAWLDGVEPVERIGASVRLYHFPPRPGSP